MITLDEIKADLSRDMEPSVADVCLNIVDKLASMQPRQMGRLTYVLLSGIVNLPANDDKFQTAMTVLTSSEHHPLDMYFLFYDEQDHREVAVTASEAIQSVREGFFVHPRTGDELKPFAHLLVPAFKPSVEFLSCIGANGR